MKKLLLSLPAISAKQGEEASFLLLSKKIRELSAKRNPPGSEADKRDIKAFQRSCLPVLHESSFLKYVFDKPQGYAGDFRTQEMIWFAHAEGGDRRYMGKTALGKLLSSLSFDMDNCLANIHRLEFIKKKIRNSGKRIASIGCGSCIELWGFGKRFMAARDFFLLDLDKDALSGARDNIAGCNGSRVAFMNENILRFLPVNKQKNLMGERDFIYCLGMIDYFSVKSAKKIMTALWQNVAPGGTLLFTNARPDNPTRLWMEYVGDWFLCYKEESDMRAIVEDLDDVASVGYSRDRFNVYQYLEVKKR